MSISRFLRTSGIILLGLFATPAMAQQVPQPAHGASRWAVALDLLVWLSLSDLQPQSGGAFDSLGFGIEASWHKPVAQFENSELLLGIDGLFGTTDSSINATYDQLNARQFYLGGSAKWTVGDARNASLDAGVGYHQVDMADVSYSWWVTYENEHWSAEKASWFVGATWDVGMGRPGQSSGLTLGFRVHFADFGTVSDADRSGVYPALGPNSGTLDGPLYVIKVGYSGR